MAEDVSQLLGNEGSGYPVAALGKIYFLSGADQRIQSAFEAYLKGQAKATAREQKTELDPDDYIELLARINDNIAAGVYAWHGPVYQRSVRRGQGLRQICWLLLKKHHPKITLEEVEQALQDNPADFVTTLKMILDDSPNFPPAQPPTWSGWAKIRAILPSLAPPLPPSESSPPAASP